MTQIQDAPTEAQVITDEVEVITAELVAKTVAGYQQIGGARRALDQAGWSTRLVANRITVDHLIEAQLVSVNGHGWWQVYANDGTPPVWMVGTTRDSDPALWDGALE